MKLTARQRQLFLLKMLILAAEVEPDASWPDLRHRAFDMSYGVLPGLTLAEVTDLASLGVGELFGTGR